MRRLIALLLVILWPLAAVAQSDDRGRLTAFLEDNLSGAGRNVTVTGFAGALSSRATVEQLTIADDAGIWLTLNGVVLDWNRLALVTGSVEVNELTAEEVILARKPNPGPDAPPSPEASGFSLPELPVSIRIGRIAAPRVVLGAAVLGQGVEGSLEASLVLSGGEGQAALAIERQDAGPDGRVNLSASYSNSSRELVFALEAEEAQGGIAATLLNLPGAPPVRLALEGDGPLTDFAATLRLETDGQERLAGQVTLTGQQDGASRFALDLGGDMAPLLLPEYAAFFGPDVRLVAEGARAPTGRLDLSRLTVAARALALEGSLLLAADGLPERFALTARLGLPSGEPVLLPLGGPAETRVTVADLTASYDAAAGEGWTLKAAVLGVDRPDLRVARLALDGSGRIARRAGDTLPPVLGATFRFDAEGVAPADPGLAAALGTALTGETTLSWQRGDDALRIGKLVFAGADYGATARGRVDGLSTGFALTGSAEATAADLSRFAALAGRPLAGSARMTATGNGSPLGGNLDVVVEVEGRDLAIGQREADNLLRGPSSATLSVRRNTTGTILRALDVAAGGARVEAEGRLATAGSAITAKLDFPELAVLGGGFGGALAAEAGFDGTPAAGRITLRGTGRDLSTGQAEADRALQGQTALDVAVGFAGERLTVERAVLSNPQGTAEASGIYDPAGSDLVVTAAVPRLAVLGGAYRGALNATARLTGTASDGRLVLDGNGRDLGIGQPQADALLAGDSTLALRLALAGPRVRIEQAEIGNPQVRAAVTGLYDPAGSDLALTADLPRLGVLGAGYGGALRLSAALTGTFEAGRLALDGVARDVTLGQPQANRLLAGDSTLALRLALDDRRLQVEEARIVNPQITASATGTVTDAERRVALEARLANLGLVLPEFPGALTLAGTLAETGGDYAVDLRAQGPGQIDATARGTLARNFRSAALRIAGSAQAALANVFLRNRAVSGPLSFDLRLDGPLALASLSGPVRLTGGRFSDPSLPFALEDLRATATLGAASAVLDAGARLTSGGALAVTGRVGLTAPFAADLAIQLLNAELRDPQLYTTTLRGALAVTGPLGGGADISGTVRLGVTELRVPSTGLGGASDLPGLRHVNEPAPVRTTRERAGLLEAAAQAGRASPARPFGLDVTIIAPNQVFVRGRGLDAELGGTVVIAGSTANVVPSGGLRLIRGRLDILGKRLTLGRATLDLQGDLVPYLDVAASTESDGVTSSVLITGRADAPVVSFTSSPEFPQEEVLARLLFGKGIQNISALQAAQLASAVATLAGRGGEGIIGRLRQGFGLDDLDVATDAEGAASVRAGKYLSRNLYTQVEIGQDGKSTVNLNLDVRKGVTVRGSVDSEGEAGIGVFLERNY